MRERGLEEAAVAAAGAVAAGLGLEQEHVACGVVGLGVQRGPEAGEAAADDAEVGLAHARRRRRLRARRKAVEPEGPHVGVGVGVAVGGGGSLRGQGGVTAPS